MKNTSSSKRIVLGWFPPAYIQIPSPAMSVLKSFLSHNGYDVDIEYWNFHFAKLQKEFLWQDIQTYNDQIADEIMLYFNYLAIYKQDQQAYNRIKIVLKGLKPQYLNMQGDFFGEHMHCYAKKLDDLIVKIVKKYDPSKILYFGFEVNLYQWICSSLVAEKMKSIHPEVPIVVGGIGTKQAAIAFLDNFPQFDIAMWGEGEAPILKLSEILRTGDLSKLNEVPNIAYRKTSTIEVATHPNKNYIDLSLPCVRPDFSEYFENVDKYHIPRKTVMLAFENSRSCHWKKCHFCYLNSGYKFRTKEVVALLDEIEEEIEKYKIFTIQFLDNDLIDNDFNRFNILLDGLIELKSKYPEFKIELGEIITKGITASVIKKMSLAGFNHVQIGYESPSDNLLRKINKKNTFASNLLFIKFAVKFHIGVNGANVLRGLIEETVDDIVEAIDNLHILRFFFKDRNFEHNISQLAITSASPYMKTIADSLSEWVINPMAKLLPNGYISKETSLTLIEYIKPACDELWGKFAEIEQYYLRQNYTYSLMDFDTRVRYREYLNGELTNELEFEKYSLEWGILNLINDEVLSSTEIKNRLIEDHTSLTDDIIIAAIDELASERLVFHNHNYSENLSILDIK